MATPLPHAVGCRPHTQLVMAWSRRRHNGIINAAGWSLPMPSHAVINSGSHAAAAATTNATLPHHTLVATLQAKQLGVILRYYIATLPTITRLLLLLHNCRHTRCWRMLSTHIHTAHEGQPLAAAASYAAAAVTSPHKEGYVTRSLYATARHYCHCHAAATLAANVTAFASCH